MNVQSLEGRRAVVTGGAGGIGRAVRSGSDGAVLVYRGSAYRESDEPAFVGIMSSVYQGADGGWRLTLYQQTPIPPTD